MSVVIPKFSILLPTKNRSEIVGGAIESALIQTCSDFELIVSDNDDSPDDTRRAVAQYRDPRVVYVRTNGKLAMHENWDNAFAHARGEFVLVLEDKMRLIPNALELLARQIDRHEGIPIAFKVGFSINPALPALDHEPRVEMLSASRLVRKFCEFQKEFFDIAPKGLNSCVSRQLLARLKASSPTGFLYSPLTPDYAVCFMILSAAPRILGIRETLIYVPNNWMWEGRYSNGQVSYKKTEAFKRFVRELPVTVEEMLELAPVKAPYLWINYVLYDYHRLCHPPGAQPTISRVDYYGYCGFLLLIGKKLGADMSEERKALMAALAREPFTLRCRAVAGAVARIGTLVWNKIFRTG
jgi:glycosyltransferase involved in cell wall biosynthesis